MQTSDRVRNLSKIRTNAGRHQRLDSLPALAGAQPAAAASGAQAPAAASSEVQLPPGTVPPGGVQQAHERQLQLQGQQQQQAAPAQEHRKSRLP